MRDDGAEEIGTHVGDGAHEQSAGAAAFDDEAVFRSVAVSASRCSALVDEVGEGVLLMHHAAGVVPGLAEVAAAADVRDGHDDAAIEQARSGWS